MENKISLGLCQGRHSIPQVQNYIFSQEVNPLDVDGLTRQAVITLFELKKQGITAINLYVTGLTVALVAVINAAITHGITLILWHFDRETGSYYPQELRS